MRAISSFIQSPIWKEYIRCKYLFLMMVPLAVYYIIFEYGPLYGVQIAFKEFYIREGIWGSPWVGFKHFVYLFTASQDFLRVMKNTLILSFYHIVFGFPAPIILALLFNEIRARAFKKITQTISYLPHFMSWVILSGLLITILSPSTGIFSNLFQWLDMKPIYFLGDPDYFRFTLVVSSIWKEAGWGTVIYLAALAGIDPHLYEASVVDGASRWKQTLHITLPGILPVITIMFIFRVGSILNAGFDQVLNLYSPNTYAVGDILDTYVYRAGLTQLQYSLAAAVGLFKNVIAFALVILTNHLAKRLGQEGIW